MIDPTPTEPRKHPPQRRRRRATERASLRLTERDRAILKAVWINRFLTRSLLTDLFPPESGAETSDHTHLAVRLRALYDHGYLDRLRAHPTAELAYALGPAGARELASGGTAVESTDWAEKNRRVGALYIEHALMVARLRIALTLALRDTPSTVLEHFRREHAELRATWSRAGERFVVKPDAFAVLRDTTAPEGKQRRAFLIETDRSTMALQRLLAKFEAYAALYAHREHPTHFGVPTFVVLTVAKSAERASNLLKLAAGLPLADARGRPLPLHPSARLLAHRALFLFTSEEVYAAHPTNVLAATWRCAATPEALRSLLPSPLPRR